METEKERIERMTAERRGKQYGTRWHSSPGNNFNSSRRKALLHELLQKHLDQLETLRVLDLGCAKGGTLNSLEDWGFSRDNLVGLDIRVDPLKASLAEYPQYAFVCADAEALSFPDNSLDVILVFSTLTMVVDDSVRRKIGAELLRTLRKGGCIIIYDPRLPNLITRQTRPVNKKDMREMFPECDLEFHATTLLPQLARLLGRLSVRLCSLFILLPFLRSHYMTVVRKRDRATQ